MPETMQEDEYAELYSIYRDQEYWMMCEFGRFVAWYKAKQRQILQNDQIKSENKKPKFFGDNGQ